MSDPGRPPHWRSTTSRQLFATPGSTGVELAVQALDGIVDRAAVAGFMTGYTRDLLDNA